MHKTKKIIAGMLGAMMLSSSAFAAQLNISYKPDDYLCFDGTDFLSDAVVVTVVPKGSEYSESTRYAVIREAIPKKGAFDFKVKMPSDAASGYYTVSVFDGDLDEICKDFYFCNPLQTKEVLSSFKDKYVTYNDFISNAAVLGIQQDLSDNIADPDLFTELFNQFSSDNTYTPDSFSGAYIGAVALCSKDISFDDFINIMQNNAKVLKCENHVFSEYPQERQKNIFENISRFKISTTNFADALTEISFLTTLADAGTKDNYKKVIFEEFDSLLNLDTADFDTLRTPYDVIVKLMDNSYTSAEDFKRAFNNAVSDQVYAESSSSSGSSGGGSGGGGFGGGGSSHASYGSDVVGAPVPVTPNITPVPEFDDMKDHWAKAAVEHLKSKNVIDGVGNNLFDPEKSVSRAEFAKMIARSFGFENVNQSNISFSDIEAGAWYAKDVYSLASSGIINGVGDGRFEPSLPVTRQDAALIMLRIADFAKISLNAEREAAVFADASQIASYALDAVNTLYSAQLINGVSTDNFSPVSSVTRAQAAQMIYNLLNKKGGSL